MEFDFGSLSRALVLRGISLTEKQIYQALHFAEFLYAENANQNLTRITGLDDFVDGHLIDSLKLFHVEQLGANVLDLGSGSGVPGLLAAALDSSVSRRWALCDSEKSKADYLKRSANLLGLENVIVHSSRADQAVRVTLPDTVIARAVGSVEKIASWIWDCSTWNKLILFKSIGWKDEWIAAKSSRFGKKLTITQTHEYSSAGKYRVLVTLTRN